MARRVGKDSIYDAATAFRDRCLVGGRSLLWPGEATWTLPNLTLMKEAFLDNPNTGEGTFLDKWKDQLGAQPDPVYRIAADVLGFYYLFPSQISEAGKLTRMRQVISWRFAQPPPELRLLALAFEAGGIGHPGAFYNTGQPFHIGLYLRFAEGVIREEVDVKDSAQCKQLVDRIEASSTSKSGAGRHILLHLLFPEQFERIASVQHKKLIVNELGSDDEPGDLDEALLAIRRRLELETGRTDLDFYDKDIVGRWRPEGETPEPPEASSKTQIWVEKTIVQGRADRTEGDYALGKMLWSPQRSKSGNDIYRFMREVREGDLVLHFTDNHGFTGTSRVAGPLAEFTGLEGTAWGGRPAYKVPLTNFRTLDPELGRDVLFEEPYASRLVQLIKNGTQNLFFNAEPALNQGAYLTPAPQGLMDILNQAYERVAGKPIFHDPPLTERGLAPEKPSAHVTLEDVVVQFANALRDSHLSFGPGADDLVRSFIASLATKRFVILTGLSGSGKSQIALKLGQWLGADRLLMVPVRPDWTGSESLFGYEDVLQEAKGGRRAWSVPEPLKFMLAAARDPQNPYLLLLDEMNLAHVERYFADALSGMESGAACLPNLLLENDGAWRIPAFAPERIPFPSNLFVIGTVNVDETTYMFSPKVLDRANTFEFRVGVGDLSVLARKPTAATRGEPSLVTGLLKIAQDDSWHLRAPASGLDTFESHLKTVHGLLAEGGFEFGHRVFYEAVRFAAMLAAAGDPDPLHALDCQLMQKILPRLHGSRRRLEAPLCALGRFTYDLTHPQGEGVIGLQPRFDPTASLPDAPRLPKSFDKIRRMTQSLRANQFTSFAE